jgi:hypothetical protein
MTEKYDVVDFLYFYRDGANWKNSGNAQFTNEQGLPIEEIKKRIQAAMLNSDTEFHPEDVDLDTHFFCDCQYDNDDYHEFDGVVFSQSAVRPERDITELIAALEASKAERNKPKPPKLALFKFTYQHKLGEPEIIRYLFIAAYTYEQAVELGNQHLAKAFPGERDGNTFYSVDTSEAAKMVDCKELLQGFFPDEYPTGIEAPRFNLYPDLSSCILQPALALLSEISSALIDETVGKMEQAGLFKPGQLDAPLKDGEPWQDEERFGANLAVDYLRERFGGRIAAVVNGANAHS